MPFPEPPEKIVPFSSGQAAPYDIERQFDEHISSFKKLVNFLKEVIRDDGMLKNGKVGPEQLAPEIEEILARRALAAVETLLEEARAEARLSAASALEMRVLLDKIREREHQIAQAATAMQQALHETKARLNELSALAASSPAPVATATPAGALGPPYATSASGIPAFYGMDQGADQRASTAVSSDYAQVSMEWAEHMPDTIPPNILVINAVTGDHWSSRWWANRSANAFGMLAWWYQGAWPSPGPPSTPLTSTNQPIPPGAMYFDTTHGAMMVWNGSTWVNAGAPAKGATQSLYYTATAGQTVFPLGTTDNTGHTFAFNQTTPEGIQALVNGVRLEPAVDFTVNTVTSTVTFLRGLSVGALAIFDLLTPASQLTPSGSANTVLLNAITPDGTTTIFPGLTVAMNGHATNISKNEELLVSVDGVQQAPGTAYTASVATLTFAEAPGADARIFLIWFGPVNP